MKKLLFSILLLLVFKGFAYSKSTLEHAMSNGGLLKVKQLVENGADVNKKNKYGDKPLRFAITYNFHDIAFYLIEKGADPLCENKYKMNYLHTLAQSSNYNKKHIKDELRLAKILIEKGIDINSKDNGGRSSLNLALGRKKIELFKFLINNGSTIDFDSVVNNDRFTRTTNPFLFVIRNRFEDLDLLKLFIKKGADVNKKDDGGATPLHWACTREVSWLDAVDILIKNGAVINSKDRLDNTALHYAATSAWPEIVHLLLRNGAKINGKNSAGETPLYLALRAHNFIMAKYLIEKGANKNTLNQQLWARLPLNFAVSNFLLENKINSKFKDRFSRELIHIACLNGWTDIVKELINRGSLVTVKDRSGNTPLHYAVQSPIPELHELLISNGGSLHAKNRRGEIPIFKALRFGNYSTAKKIIKKGVDVNIKDNRGSPVWSIVYQRQDPLHKEFIMFLIESGIDVNGKDVHSWTLLHVAALRGWLDVTKILLKKGADPNHKDSQKKTPLDLAKYYNHKDIVECLTKVI
ncbi:MAG: hypothetical protein GY714_09915 [Desulfobacterales bacterium]|nr:hypothetical protein [Desulfobacterales bacterium]